MKPQPTAKALGALVADLDEDELEMLTDTNFRHALKRVLADELAVLVQSYFSPLEDCEVPEQFRPALPGWRTLATDLDHKGPIAWRVQAGYTLKHHAPRTGACRENWQYLQGWVFKNDEPTRASIVLWVPRLVVESTSKTVEEQLARLVEVRTQYGLPEKHLASFGSGALLSGLVLAHFKRTGERVPLDKLWARTDTILADGGRFCLGVFGEAGLSGGYWGWGVGGRSYLGVFPLGVEVLGA